MGCGAPLGEPSYMKHHVVEEISNPARAGGSAGRSARHQQQGGEGAEGARGPEEDHGYLQEREEYRDLRDDDDRAGILEAARP